jgi:hypothetical protein
MTFKRVMGFVATFAGWLLLVLAAVEIGLVFYYRPTIGLLSSTRTLKADPGVSTTSCASSVVANSDRDRD